MTPALSIITASYQNADALIGCLESVSSQGAASFEHIVIDGGSTDATLPLLEERSGQLAAWVSEADSGISEAMNKGISFAKGEWTLFLHADDRFHGTDTLAAILPLLSDSDADIVAFPIMYGDHPSRTLYPRGANTWLRLKTGFLHQGAFIRRSVFDRIGKYDTRLKIAMDYEFFLRAWLAGLKFSTHSSPIVARMSDGGISSKLEWPMLKRRLTEEKTVHLMHANSFLLRLFYSAFWMCYPTYKYLAARMASHKRHERLRNS